MDTDRIISHLRPAEGLTVLLDYDGTLVPIAMAPELAVPDASLMSLLAALADRPHTSLHIVSGRPRETLQSWFGHLQASLWAEHGFWHRVDGAWHSAAAIPDGWMRSVAPILTRFTEGTPGSHIEPKSASIAWHYRGAAPEVGERQAAALRRLLREELDSRTLEVLDGKKVIEVRLRGVSKGLVAQQIAAPSAGRTAVLAIGDDRTDEDMFAALPDWSVTVAVGSGPTIARFRVDDEAAVRDLLRSLVAHP